MAPPVRDHGAVTAGRPQRARARVPVALGTLAAAVLLAAGSADGAVGCPVTMRVTGSAVGVRLDPGAVTVEQGSCLAIANTLNVPVEVHVEPGFDRQVPPDGQVRWPAASLGSHAVTAATLVSRDRGTVTVRAAPEPSRSATASSPPPSPKPPPTSASTSPTPDRTSARPSRGPGSDSPSPATSPPRTPTAPPSLPTTPPTPPPVPSPSATAVVAGPVEPPTDRSLGLPAALAALAIVGTGGGLLRVLLAEPVDGSATVGGSA
jgi:hypothetical protein